MLDEEGDEVFLEVEVSFDLLVLFDDLLLDLLDDLVPGLDFEEIEGDGV